MAGVAACVPENVVATEDIPLMSAEEAEVFNNTVGIRRRHIAPDNICASDMCQKAADALLAELGWERDSIDVLIFESVTGDYRTPPTSCILQDRMGLPDTTFCLDMPMGCCGCLYAITVGANLLTTGNVRRALLLIGDTALRMGSMKDKSRVPLFGDCGTAIALEYDTAAPAITVDFHTLGKGYKALMTPHGGFRNPATPESFIEEDFGNGIVRAPYHTLINGMDVFSFAISRPPKSVAQFMEAEEINKDNVANMLAGCNGILVPGGFGYRGVEGKIEAIRYAREKKIPFFGICLGMQCAVMEFARNVAGLKDANSEEFVPDCKNNVIYLIKEWFDFRTNKREVRDDSSDKGGTMRLGAYPCKLKEGTKSYAAYVSPEISERHRHRYEFNNKFKEILEEKGLVFSGTSPDNELMEIIEIADHPWFVGCQFHPEFKSNPMKPHPLFRDFIAASIRNI